MGSIYVLEFSFVIFAMLDRLTGSQVFDWPYLVNNARPFSLSAICTVNPALP